MKNYAIGWLMTKMWKWGDAKISVRMLLSEIDNGYKDVNLIATMVGVMLIL